MDTTIRVPGHELARRWEELLAQNRKLRAREAAAALGVSEAELVASGVGRNARRLRADWPALLTGLEAVRAVTTITRNDACVHEKTGTWRNVEISPMHALVLDEAIDLRLFPRAWKHAFAVTSEGPHGTRRSVQVFDGAGTAVLKVFAAEGADLAAFDALIDRLAHEDQSPDQIVEPARAPQPERPDADVDAATLRTEWRALKDTHDFFILLHRLGIARTQALRLAEPEFAWRAPAGAFRQAMTAAAEGRLPIMIFVANPGAIQIHTGPIMKLQDVGPWFNVLDPDFNLHLLEGEIAEAWAVRKPTVDGIVSALELFDRAGRPILQMFGKRKPGIPELPEWRALLERVAPREAVTA